ncbi:MAG: hypothetical protein FWC41_09785 [Firmicutes bacterium]|nr:hypothetical protein [Bacillota bacterium]
MTTDQKVMKSVYERLIDDIVEKHNLNPEAVKEDIEKYYDERNYIFNDTKIKSYWDLKDYVENLLIEKYVIDNSICDCCISKICEDALDRLPYIHQIIGVMSDIDQHVWCDENISKEGKNLVHICQDIIHSSLLNDIYEYVNIKDIKIIDCDEYKFLVEEKDKDYAGVLH